MHILLNFIAFFAYAGLAAAAALHAPRLAIAGLPPIGQMEAYVLAGFVFLAGLMMHQTLANAARGRAQRERAVGLAHDVVIQQEELDWLRREVAALREALEAAGASGDLRGGGRTIEEVMSEVRVLKSLIGRLSTNGEAAPPAAQAAASAAESPHRDAPAPTLVHSTNPPLTRKLPPVAANLSDEQVLKAVREALRNDQVDLVLQPIVSLPQRKRRYYECFSRLRTADGTMILPEQYIAIAERAKLITAIDNMLLFRCVQLIRKIHRKNQDIDFFCNISPYTLADTDFFKDFLDFLNVNQELAGHLVFEFAQADFDRWSEAGAGLLSRLTLLGCRVSLDQIRNPDLDPDQLVQRRVSFVKVEANLLLDTLGQRADLVRALRRREIDLIVEKVEDESRLLELLDHEIDFGQGYLFGEPRLARPAA
jgi:cyclic-di-GMP phosphodiesterase TipF (flagellum assembly factor)